MTWSKLNPNEPETIYTSNADNFDEISNDLCIVVRRMIENRTADHSEKVFKLLLYTNATNGWIQLQWFDEKEIQAGDWIYHLELPKLWETANNHEQGSFHFNNETHIAICIITEILIDDEGNDLEIYTQTELKGPERLYI